MLLRCLDFETTGEDPDPIDLVEVGFSDVRQNGEGVWGHHGGVWGHHGEAAIMSALVNAGVPITPVSSAVHHIINEDLVGAVTPVEAVEWVLSCPTLDSVLVAHNASYEQKVLGGKRGYRWIDTWKIAVVLAPAAPSWGLQQLRYWLKLDVDRTWARPAHRAGPDAYVNSALLIRMLAKLSPEQMIDISSRPVLLPYFHFGKYKKCPIAELPTSYFDWILGERDKDENAFDENVIATCTNEIERRRRRPRS